MSDLDYLLDSLRESQLNLNDCLESDIFVTELTEVRELVNNCLDVVEGLLERAREDASDVSTRQLKFPVLSSEEEDGDVIY